MRERFIIRSLAKTEEAVLLTMLMHAARESSMDSVRANSDIMRYADDWGRSGDVGVIAEIDGKPMGAAWLRLWTEDNRGFGYLNEETPELAIALIPEARNQGIGTALLKQLLAIAQPQFSAVCLSVRANNPALRLYERVGFVRVADTAVINRVGEESFTMIHQFTDK